MAVQEGWCIIPNVTCWDTDGTTFRIYSNGVLVLETPLNAATGTPTEALVMDPSTGLPATFPVGSGGFGFPPGSIGDLLWYDGTAWVILPASGADTFVLRQTASAGDLIPSWQAELSVSTPTVVPTGLDPNEVRCAVADFMITQLYNEYSFFAAYMQTKTQFELAAAASGVQTVINQFGGEIGSLLKGYSFVPGAVVNALSFLAQAQNAFAFLPLGATAVDNIRHSLYCVLPAPTAGGLTINATVIQAWRDSIATSGYPGFILVGPTNFQQQIVEHVIAMFSIWQWGEWAQQASGQTSTICSGYGCPFP